MSDRVTWTLTDGVADVRMNRPDKMNALDSSMFQGLVDVGTQLAHDKRVRAVVLSGEGRAFCAGLDFGSFQSMAGGPTGPTDAQAPATNSATNLGETQDGRITHFAQQAVWAWQEIPAPVIAAVHGVALGGGCQLALGADIRYCTADAKFSILEIRWGLIPDMTGTYTLTKLVGLDVAKELTFTGRMVLGEEAVRLGMATRVCADPLAEALTTAREIASKSPHATRAAKRLFNLSPDSDPATQFAAERREIAQLVGSPNQVESIMAYFEKREATFTDV
jgi:enoyl-CoA hydratase/carnithine racemase